MLCKDITRVVSAILVEERDSLVKVGAIIVGGSMGGWQALDMRQEIQVRSIFHLGSKHACFGTCKTIGVWNVHTITKSLTVMSRIRRDIKPLLQHNSRNNLIFVPWLQSIDTVYVDSSQESYMFFSSKEWTTQLRSVWYMGSEFKYSK